MKIDEMREEEVEVEVEEVEEAGAEAEEDLSEALELLDSCARLLEVLVEKDVPTRKMGLYLKKEILSVAEEVNAFLAEYGFDDEKEG